MKDKQNATLLDIILEAQRKDKAKEIISKIENAETLDDIMPSWATPPSCPIDCVETYGGDDDYDDELSNRASDFYVFSNEVIAHIENYTVPQYGDSPGDLVDEWTVQQCLDSAKKYLARHGRNQREGQDELDLIKAAHYIQIAHTKLKK